MGELKAQMMKLELNFDNSTNAESSTSAPIAGYAVLPAVHSLKLLDLYCCGGGAGYGYEQAGYDVTGVDIEPQPKHRSKFI